ncbi:MAG: hypothetical protein ACR2QC_11755 [Gammaproteobacteria bacterium]
MFDRPSYGDVRRRITARLAVLSAVLLAAGAAIIPANAQQATMAVFAPSSEVVGIEDFSGNARNVNLNGNISTIVSRISTNVNANLHHALFDLLNPDDGTLREEGRRINADGLPAFGQSASSFPVSPGDLMRIRENFTGTVGIVQGYVNGENPPGLTLFVSVGVGTASDLAAGQFFINENGITTTTPSTDNLGYAGPSCDAEADMAVDGNGLICELDCREPEVENTVGTMCMDPLTDADCEAMMSGSEPNDDRNECVFTARSCSGIGGVINSGTDGCDFTDDSCGMVEAGMGANTAGDGCDFTDSACQMVRVGSEASGGGCVCPAGEDRLDDVDGVDYCVAFEPPAENSATANSLYTSANCADTDAGNWTVAYEFDSSTPAEIVAELCAIPYEKLGAASSSSADGLTPLQISTGDGDNCVIRINGGATATTALCGDDQLFAENGFPIKPAGFDVNANRLTVDADGAVSFNDIPVPQFKPTSDSGGGSVSTTVAASAPASKKSGQHALGVGAGLGVLVYLYAWHYYDGDIGGLFNFSPDYGYSVTESGYSYRYGGRLDFRNEDLHLYWKAGQANSNGDFGDFRYESGGEYSADFWTASFSEVVRSEESDYDFSLSADYRGGIWRVSPTYRLRHSRFAEKESETANSLNLEGVLRYNRWTISPSAGFNWESADEFGDNARFNLSAVRRF